MFFVFGDAAPSFEVYAFHQLCCDVVFAFQEDHKQANQALCKLYVGESLAEKKHDEIRNMILSYVLNFNDTESHYSMQSQNSPRHVIFYSQIINFIKQDLLEAGDEFVKKFNERIIECCKKYDFNTSG